MSTYQQTPIENYGDANVRPNTGVSNQTAFGGDLKDLKWKLRMTNVITCGVSLFLAFGTITGQLSTLHPARGVLALYLTFFCGLLCSYEIRNKRLDLTISDSFGFLYNPLTRACLLFMMGLLAVGMAGSIEVIAGFVFIFNAGWTLFLYARFKEYRKWSSPGEEEDLFAISREQAKQYAWANPNAVGAAAGAIAGTNESRPLNV